MFLLAFNAFARIWEITITNNSTNVLQLADISISSINGHHSCVAVTFHHFKHNLSGPPHTITFGHGHTISSAVQSLHEYIEMRSPLFCLANKRPVTRLVFDRHLHRALSKQNLQGT